MKNYFLVTALFASLAFTSCKKEETQPTASTIPFPTNSGVSSIALNGGNVSGRWTLTYEEYNSYENNVLVGSDTSHFTPGDIIVNYLSGGVLQILDGDTTTGTWSVSGNQMTLVIDSDVFTTSYGINSQGTMRWHMSNQTVVGPDVYRDDDDYLFVRY